MKPIVLQVQGELDREQLDGKLFQIHVRPDGRLKLVPVQVLTDRRCPVVVDGERCGGYAGHDGKHF